MNSIIDPWVAHYWRLMEILKKAGVYQGFSPRILRKLLIMHRKQISYEEFKEAMSLFEYLYKGEE